ncbi:hypothetical protein C8R48DRAFT_669661 [Suillus tomentosus]|nr:hypothetical protein C8R48DRAFT_669661 [Suillus tomentosus]
MTSEVLTGHLQIPIHPGHCALSFSLPLQLLFFVAMSNYELVSQYTKDAFAKEDWLRQRPACGANIAKGDPCFYVATIEHDKPGHYVCGPCHEHYQKKAATSERPAMNQAKDNASSQQTMCSSTGYTPHHAHYGSECDRWEKLSYAPPPSQTISLKILAVHEGGSRKKGGRGTPFGNSSSETHDGWIYRVIMHLDVKALKSPIFKTKQFALMVVVPESQWHEYEEWTERVEEWTERAEEDEATCQAPMATTTISEASVDVFQGEDYLATEVPLPEVPLKRPHLHTASSLSSTSPLLLKKAASANIFRSPDPNVDAQSVYDLQNKNVQLYWIATRPMSEILENSKYQSFTLHTAESASRQLTVDTSLPIQSAEVDSRLPILGSIPHQKVVVKRPFIKIFPPNGPSAGTYKVGRYTVADELSKQFKEANVLYWANLLLDLIYAFINCCVAASSNPPPFEIPCLHFIHAGLALSYLAR